MEEETVAGSDPRAAPQLIVPMSLQLAIPRRVALQQSSRPLHQPRVILKEKRKFEKEKSLNCMCANSKLSQQRGSPQKTVPNFVPRPAQKIGAAQVVHGAALGFHADVRIAFHHGTGDVPGERHYR